MNGRITPPLPEFFKKQAFYPYNGEKAVWLAAVPYVPYGVDSPIDSYYVTSNKAFKLLKDAAAHFNALGFETTPLPKDFFFKPFALERCFAGAEGFNTLTYTRAFGSRFYYCGLLLGGETLAASLKSGEIACKENAEKPFKMPCASCRACVDACPAGAIGREGGIARERCVRNAMNTGVYPSEENAAAALGHIMGCDICQRVCPVNAKAESPAPIEVFIAVDGLFEGDTYKAGELIGTNFAKGNRLILLALNAAANKRETSRLPQIEKLALSGDPQISAAATRALSVIKG